MRTLFDLQRFGGSSSSSTTQTYEPSEYELQLQKAQADYAKAVSPNALRLNDLAWNLLNQSLGTVQVDYNTLNRNAQQAIANAQGGQAGLVNSNNAAADAANTTLGNISNQYGTAANSQYGRLQTLADQYRSLANSVNNNLGGLVPQYASAADDANKLLSNYINLNARATDDANADLSEYINRNTNSWGTADSSLADLGNGYLPQSYLNNMSDAIRTAINRTVGSNINDLAQRGVINSSVTSSALNDIERNVSDTMAQQYLNNINTVGNLANQRLQNALNTDAANAAMTQDQLNNIINNSTQGANLAQQRYGITSDALGNIGNIYQQQYNNASNSLGNITGIYNQQYADTTGALGNQASLAQQRYTNTLGANEANNNVYNNVINNATAGITTAASAQEAAQQPALNLWNASLGLNGSTTSALAAAAGKGTTTTTQTQSGGSGSFLNGLLGAAGSIGTAMIACFIAGTKILMADRTEKNIEDIKLGDKVMTASGKAGEVTKLMKPKKNAVFELVTDSGRKVRTTATQPFMLTDGTYKDVIHLRPGMELVNVGTLHSKRGVGLETVYDIQVAGDNSYIAEGFVAEGGGNHYWHDDREV